MSDASHEHKFEYVGVRYAEGYHTRPGSGAHNRYYAHVYFCPSCLEHRYELIKDVDDNTYNKVQFSATPGSRDDIVPTHDRR